MKKLLFIVLIALLFYTRFVNVGWGLPYPMHPDERNMASAVQQLSCPSFFSLVTSHQSLTTCFNPHFFAYGQLPLYLAYGGIQAYHFITGGSGQPTYIEATLALRAISALSSIALVLVLLRIITLVYPQKKLENDTFHFLAFIFLIFSPYAIQLSHFGTTESLLMLFYMLIVYFSLKLLTTNHYSLTTIFLMALFSGLALGTKISSLLFLGVPILVILIKTVIGGRKESCDRIYRTLSNLTIWLFVYLFICLFVFILSSPHNFLNWNEFISSMTYESRVGLGRFVAFYTRQFVQTPPIIFQMTRILPYALGWPKLIGAILGFFFLPSYVGKMLLYLFQVARLERTRNVRQTAWPIRFRQVWSSFGERKIGIESSALLDILRISLILSFLPPSFFFAKWTRFISPSFPLFSLFALLFFFHLFHKVSSFKFPHFAKTSYIILLIAIIPGLAYLSIYTSSDVRFAASKWMYNTIPAQSKILSETANAIDLPIDTGTEQSLPSTYLINSFNFYDLDQSLELQSYLDEALQQADYIIIPSRRIYFNHTCLTLNTPSINMKMIERCKELEKTYPVLNAYYRDLFSGNLGFEKVAEFSSFPTLSLLGKKLWQFPDEMAEETWTVFDHPVIRIYKKIQAPNSNSKVKSSLLDFSDYQTINYQIPTSRYSLTTSHSLLVADAPEKWERGLMNVTKKEDIGGRDGMIFIFSDSQVRSFWNKNTLSHLTLYWLQNDEVVGISDLPSITETGVITSITSPSPVNMVIEIIK